MGWGGGGLVAQAAKREIKAAAALGGGTAAPARFQDTVLMLKAQARARPPRSP